MERDEVYEIKKFKRNFFHHNLYVNTFQNHLKEHRFIESLHRHDFYVLVLFTNGTGLHKIDFDTFDIIKGSLFLMQPGQIHLWELSSDIDGYIVFFSKEIYNLHFRDKKIEEYLFFQSSKNNPELVLNTVEMRQIQPFFELMVNENQEDQIQKKDKMLNLLDCILIEILRIYNVDSNHLTSTYNHKLKEFELLLEQYYRTEKSPSFYADKMAITLKHLNRISKNILNITITELITRRVILESKRIMVDQNKTIAQIADELGYSNYSYFSKLFKKNVGITPTEFVNQLKN
ncbi:AraC family transcriptional regulator [Flavobacterium sp.]|uniref:helix-turn-helix domain-containing protein n=1 Tax=Flavobacterium sp. TaxID=239 RepID=UPI0008BF5E1D|nr:AraC family transcriptional regulator [Flavobacterium sp.]OGS62497.1 MAG: AraC family transcriptional regulator [Flavobacteria bacterium GWF1_32_7]HBD27430.1 AraC family transcriptional regulator [Flavobacterium sp.]